MSDATKVFRELIDAHDKGELALFADAVVRAREVVNAPAAPAAPAEPVAGWRMVPVEPTKEMIDAGWKNGTEGSGVQDLAEAYRFMLDAAPAAPAEPVAWWRMETLHGVAMPVYYGTKAWPDLQPLYAAPPPLSAEAEDAARVDYLQAVMNRSKARGFYNDAIHFDTHKPVREQIDEYRRDAARRAQEAGNG